MMTNNRVQKILRIDSSASHDESITRRLGDEVLRRLQRDYADADVMERNLNNSAEFITEHWVQANLTNPDERNQTHHEVLAESDQLVAELDAADVVVITAPVYNFSIPATLKAWIDMICRARLSFHYTENGPEGLLKDRPVYLVMASGGVPFGSAVDFASGYLHHILSFIGITDVRPVYAERTNANISASEASALQMLDRWLPVNTTSATV